MKLDEFFSRLEKDYGINRNEFCRAKKLCEATIRNVLSGSPISERIGKKIAKATLYKVTIKDLGL